jgi:excisionase family DNA binding protein
MGKRDSDEDLITISEAAEIRGASVSAISHLVRRGRLRSVERFGKTLVYRSDVENFEPDKPGPKGVKKSGKN